MEQISQLRVPSARKTSIIYYKESYRYSTDGGLSAVDHLLLQVGENRRTFPEVVDAYSGDSWELTDFAARIVNKGGNVRSLGQGDLYTVNLSGQAVTESRVVELPLNGSVREGDLIEEYARHRITMPRLGIYFSLGDVGMGRNIECSVDVPDNLVFRYLVVNDTTKPVILAKGNRKEYVFRWRRYLPDENQSTFGPLDSSPGIYGYVTEADDSTAAADPWIGFGDWYLNLVSKQIAYDQDAKQLAEKITAGIQSPKEKMDALFNYCQKNIRYEQVYLKNGDIVPNYVSVILKRNYGDCKDYSTALYALAHSIGLEPCLALAYRGRGEVFYPNVPVSQFNHMLVYFRYHGKIYWYDGTDTQGIPGLTSDDLINQDALVLERGDSRIVRIAEDPGNRLSISGTLNAAGNGFNGDVMSLSPTSMRSIRCTSNRNSTPGK